LFQKNKIPINNPKLKLLYFPHLLSVDLLREGPTGNKKSRRSHEGNGGLIKPCKPCLLQKENLYKLQISGSYTVFQIARTQKCEIVFRQVF